jgi:predicted DNA-binding transcriptional regulator AlpA
MASRLIKAESVREVCGGVSDMTLWRWLNDPTMCFPQPIYIARRRFWKEAELVAWLEAQPRAGKAA